MENIINRFVQYAKIETTSDPKATTRPSTSTQHTLLKLLNEQLLEFGLDVVYDQENGYIYAKLAANIEGKDPIGFIAHVDTAPDYSAHNVKPQIIENYDGGDIHLNDTTVLSPTVFPSLNNYKGQTLITTDGTTLLGADDKAGIAEIMEAVKYYVDNPQLPHGQICVAFTSDEEIGTGADQFDVEQFGAKFAYTIDGGVIGELQYENFNAASAVIEIEGRSVHPGTAKNQMINSQELAHNFHASMPSASKPEYTCDYEGFIMLAAMNGDISTTTLSYIIRDHDKDLFENKKQIIEKAYELHVKPYAINSSLTITDQYYNMGEIVNEQYEIIELAKTAIENCDVKVDISPIRGGTDGSKLSFKGLPCPNIFTGGHNFHGRFEYVVVESMQKATQAIIEIIRLNANK